ncbi:uncharacterized protein ACIBXB_018181 isoform 3-T5 [Morphnus guianensis]
MVSQLALCTEGAGRRIPAHPRVSPLLHVAFLGSISWGCIGVTTAGYHGPGGTRVPEPVVPGPGGPKQMCVSMSLHPKISPAGRDIAGLLRPGETPERCADDQS